MNREANTPRTGRGGRDRGDLLFPAVALLFYAALAARLWFLTDDAFISFRYARNWVEGYGLRFNPGSIPPVEGYSNFAWTALIAGLDLLGLDPVAWSCPLSGVLGLGVLLVLWRVLRKHLELPGWAAFLGLLVTGLSPTFAAWTSGGLETMLFVFLLLSVFHLLFVRREGPRPGAAGLCAGLLSLTRPEGIVWALVLGGLFLVQGRDRAGGGRRRILPYLGGVLLFFLPYLVFRYLYFGRLLPNTFYAKAGWRWLTWKRGLLYTVSYLLSTVTPVAVLVALPALSRRGVPRAARTAVVVLLGALAYGIFSGGDFMAFGRFLAPAAPFFGLAAAVLLARWGGGRDHPPAWLPAAGLACLVQVLPAFGVEPVPAGLRAALHFRWNSPVVKSELEQWCQMKSNLEELTLMGKMLRRIARPGDSYVGAAIGAVGYYSGLTVYDMCGLVDLEVARREDPNPVPRSPGHDKYVEPEYFLPRHPTYLRVLVVPKKLVPQVKNDYARKLPHGYVVESRRVPPRLVGGRRDLYLVMQRTKE